MGFIYFYSLAICVYTHRLGTARSLGLLLALTAMTIPPATAQVAGIELPGLATASESGEALDSELPEARSKISACPELPGRPAFGASNIRRLYPLKPAGAPTSDIYRKSPKYRITYHTHGLAPRNGCISDSRLEAVETYIRQLVQTYPHLYSGLEDPRFEALRTALYPLLTDPHAFGHAIDRCFAQTLKNWNQCRGRFTRTARKMRRLTDKLRVQVMPAYFFLDNSTAGATWAGGMANTDMRTMFATVTSMAGHTLSAPFVWTFESIVCWEMGNTFAMNMGYYPRTAEREIGNRPPCKILRR